ncbi:MAG: hypothetical protein JXB35_05445, partial [Anaerolineae bacterium]|nr:hypothetical protein [Anaerolineae bacterium]
MTSWWAPERLLSLSRWLFGLFFLLALGTALPLAPDIDVTPIAWESLGFLLAGALLAWGVSLWQWRTFLQVHWGRLAPPLAGLTLWFLINGLSVSLRRLAIQGVVWAFVWAAMLLYLNTRPRLRGVVALIIGIQSLVAIGQFVLQRDLGLQFLGERPLVPTVEGISVLLDSEQRVLRSYGLTGHPNYLGATLAIFTLFLLDQVEDAASIERWEIASAIVVGGVGLVLSFSRAAWLGFGAAVAAWIGLQLHAHRNIRTAWPQVRRLWMLLPAVLILIPARNLVVSRLFTLDNALETQSIS